MVDDSEHGQTARTRYRVLELAGNTAAWVELQPLTGRTHQLRVHMAAIGHPIVGDGKYGGPDAFLTGSISRKMHLHARRLIIALPPHGRAGGDKGGDRDRDGGGGGELDVTAELPEHFAASMAQLGFDPALGFALPEAPPPPGKARAERPRQRPMPSNTARNGAASGGGVARERPAARITAHAASDPSAPAGPPRPDAPRPPRAGAVRPAGKGGRTPGRQTRTPPGGQTHTPPGRQGLQHRPAGQFGAKTPGARSPVPRRPPLAGPAQVLICPAVRLAVFDCDGTLDRQPGQHLHGDGAGLCRARGWPRPIPSSGPADRRAEPDAGGPPVAARTRTSRFTWPPSLPRIKQRFAPRARAGELREPLLRQASRRLLGRLRGAGWESGRGDRQERSRAGALPGDARPRPTVSITLADRRSPSRQAASRQCSNAALGRGRWPAPEHAVMIGDTSFRHGRWPAPPGCGRWASPGAITMPA